MTSVVTITVGQAVLFKEAASLGLQDA